MRRMLTVLTGAGMVCVMTLSLSCTDAGSELEPPPPEEPQGDEVSFAQQIQPVFNGNGCVGCHGGSGGLFLTQGVSYNNLVNVNAQASCTTLKRVLPGNAAQSVLFIRVSSNSADTDCGVNSRMPKDGTRLPQATIDLLEDWINQGAKNN
ncbi:MAG TPA: hypothetical protein VIL52_05830 [Bacteroidota bacterium]